MKNLNVGVALLLASSLVRADGFDQHYAVHSGDLDGDSRIDLYVKWSPKIVLIDLDDLPIPIPTSRRDVDTFVLQQTASGSFNIVSDLSGSQTALVAAWPKVPSTVIVAVEDFNADGYMDISLRSLNQLISGVLDQIVYAPTQSGASPAAVRAIDAPTVKFFKESYGWLTNASYFAQNAPQIPATPGAQYFTYLGYIYEPYPPYWAASCAFYPQCQYRFGNINDPFADPNDTDGIPNVWHWWGVITASGSSVADYSVFDQRSLSLAAILVPVLNGTQDITAGGAIEQAVKAILQAVLGVEIHGGVFGGGQGSYEDDEGISTDRFRALIQLALAIQAQQATPPAPTYVNPLPGAWINKANSGTGATPPYNCTADGRFGTFRPGGHSGVDLGTSSTKSVVVGTDVYAVGSGTAVGTTGFNGGHGNQVELYHSGGVYLFRYSHLSGWVTRLRVTGGVVVGQVGKTGNASAACIKPHLHFEAGNRKTNLLVNPGSVSSVFTWSLEP